MAVADERNFTRAADRLGIAQPSLSRQIRDLEETLKLALFERESRPIALTAAGRLFFEQAQRVLGAVAQAEGAMTRFRVGTRRPFMIGFVGSTIYGPVPTIIRRFREAAPDLEIDLLEMNTIAQIGGLNEGRIDAGLGRLSIADQAISQRVVELEKLVLAVPVGHALAARRDPVSLGELIDETIILYPSEPRPSYADQVLRIFEDHGLSPRTLREVRELQTALGLVSAEAGILLVPASVQRLQRDDVVYLPLAETGATSPIILNWRSNDASKAIDTLLAICATLAPAHVGGPTPVGGPRTLT